MSVRLMADVWDCEELTDATLVNVLVVLANSADDAGGNCYPGTALIARRTRYSERTVIRAIAELERQGWITILQRGNGRPGGKTRREREEQNLRHRTQYQIDAQRLKGCQPVTYSPEPERVTTGTKKGDTGTKKGDIDGEALKVGSVPDPKSEPSTPWPPQAGEGRGVNTDPIGVATDRVMRECGFTARRLRAKLRGVIAQRLELGEAAEAVADRMIAAWKYQDSVCDQLSKRERAAPFFEEGIWLNWRRLHWNPIATREEKLASEARAGSLR